MKIICILEYLLEHTSIPIEVKPDNIYILPIIAMEKDKETGATFIWIRCDTCSLAEVVAILSPHRDVSLRYKDVQGILTRHGVVLTYLIKPPRDSQSFLRYSILSSILKRINNNQVLQYILEEIKDELFTTISGVEEHCKPVL